MNSARICPAITHSLLKWCLTSICACVWWVFVQAWPVRAMTWSTRHDTWHTRPMRIRTCRRCTVISATWGSLKTGETIWADIFNGSCHLHIMMNRWEANITCRPAPHVQQHVCAYSLQIHTSTGHELSAFLSIESKKFRISFFSFYTFFTQPLRYCLTLQIFPYHLSIRSMTSCSVGP
jgi:hypothetical protein